MTLSSAPGVHPMRDAAAVAGAALFEHLPVEWEPARGSPPLPSVVTGPRGRHLHREISILIPATPSEGWPHRWFTVREVPVGEVRLSELRGGPAVDLAIARQRLAILVSALVPGIASMRSEEQATVRAVLVRAIADHTGAHRRWRRRFLGGVRCGDAVDPPSPANGRSHTVEARSSAVLAPGLRRLLLPVLVADLERSRRALAMCGWRPEAIRSHPLVAWLASTLAAGGEVGPAPEPRGHGR